MSKTVTRPLKAFLCHASGDKPAVREMYKRLVFEGVDAWLDKEKLLPGQDWRVEIPKAVQEADVVIVFLSKNSITKEGYVQKEIKDALDVAEEKPEGVIFLIPARLEECLVPERLSRWQWVDLFEDNGFIQLLRSLKSRARAVGATIEQASYQESDSEVVRRVEQLYTEGLAAFYTEEWDKACRRFQTILSEYPNHKNAAEKLAEAETQRNLARLYALAEQEYQAENWIAAIQSLEDLLQKAPEYKDASQLLRNAKKQKRLKELYAEAKTLHTAQKWQAVLKVFEQISAIEPACPDPDSLLPSAQKEVAELKRIADLNEQYSFAVRRMDAGEWLEARTLLEKVHKSQTGFLETERLLRKAETEIVRVEEKNKRIEQINVLYEQAHGLVRTKNWRKALDKMEEIQKLDSQFEDKDGITEQAKTELAREEQEIQRQNELAAIYAESVRLMQEKKYQEALDKWDEVWAVDPKYPDRQWVQRTAKKKLAEMTKPVKVKPVKVKPQFVMPKLPWKGIAAIVVAAVVIVGIAMLTRNNQLMPQVPTPDPMASGYADPTMYDDFDAAGETLDGSRWDPGGIDPAIKMTRQNGILAVQTNGYGEGVGLMASKFQNKSISKPFFIEASFKLEPNQNGGAGIHIWAGNKGTLCQIWRNGSQAVACQYLGDEYKEIGIKEITSGTWHSARIEVDPSTMTFTYYIDGSKIGTYTPSIANELKSATFTPSIWSGCAGDGCTDKSPRTVTGYFDNVRMGVIEDDPVVYDDFDGPSHLGSYNPSTWSIDTSSSHNTASQMENGTLTLANFGPENYIDLMSRKYTEKALTSPTYIKSYFMKPSEQNGGVGIVVRISEIGAFVACYIRGDNPGQSLTCEAFNFGEYKEIVNIPINPESWHAAYIEVDPSVPEFTFYVDGKDFGNYTPPQPEHYKSAQYKFFITSFCAGSGCSLGESDMVEGIFDYVEIGIP